MGGPGRRGGSDGVVISISVTSYNGASTPPLSGHFDEMGGNIGRDLGLGDKFLFQWHTLWLVLRLNPWSIFCGRFGG